MYNAGQMQLQSATWLQGHSGDRPSFEAVVCHTFAPNRVHQVFMMPQGLLFLELRKKVGSAIGNANQNAVVMGAVMGGLIGAAIAGAVSEAMSNNETNHENFEMCSEDELYQLAAQRKKSFVSKNDEIISVTIDAPGGFTRMFGNSKLAGYITVRDRKLGKVKMEVYDQAALSVAVDSLPRRLKERVIVNVAFDQQNTRFVPR
jgi:hypothetical protein